MILRVLSLFIVSLLASEYVSASINYAKERRQLQQRKMGLISKSTHKRLERASLYLRHEKYNKAQEIYLELLKQTENRKDEYAQIWQQLGFMLAQKGDMDKAIKALENSVEVNALPYQLTMSSLYTLAQLNLAQEKFEKSEEVMRRWFGLAEGPQAEAYILMGSILFQQDKNRSSHGKC